MSGLHDAGDVAQDGEEDVDQEIGSAAALEEDAERGQDDGDDDLADVAVAEIRVSRSFSRRMRVLMPESHLAVNAISSDFLWFERS